MFADFREINLLLSNFIRGFFRPQNYTSLNSLTAARKLERTTVLLIVVLSNLTADVKSN